MQTLMPDSHEKLLKLKPELVAQMVERLPEVAARLVVLRTAFPTADIAQMITRQPTLVLSDDFQEIQQAGEKLSAILPGIEVDRCTTVLP